MHLKTAPFMGKEQVTRNNKYLTLIMSILYVFFTIGTFMEFALSKTSSKPLTLITLLAGIIMLLVNQVMYRLKKESKYYILVAFGGFTLTYFMAMTFSMTTMYAYVFPVLIIVCAYMNQKLSFYAIVFTVIINVINIAKVLYVNGGMNDLVMQTISVQIITIILACIGTFFITKIVSEGTEHNLEMTQKQIDIVDQTVEIAEEMHADFQSLKAQLDSINENIHENSNAVSNISEGVKYTATEISKELIDTEKIKGDMEHTNDEAVNVYDETNTIVDILHKGMKHLEDLEVQSKVVNDHIDLTTQKLGDLTKQVSQVATIANSIIDISGQTNLLSLNASIEAARAGEAGKGFAVVSEQIRLLADETKNASEQITEIIEELNHITSQTSVSLDNSIQSIVKQGELLDAATESYQNSFEHVKILTGHVDDIKENLKDTIHANLEIVDSVTNLSSSSEEVSASTNDVYGFTVRIGEEMDKFVDKINEMDSLMDELEKTVRADNRVDD